MRASRIARREVRAAAIAATLLIAAGCAGERQDAVKGSADELVALRQSATVVLPAELPPGLELIESATGDGLPLISFYSTNQPLVTVCTGPLERCESLTTPRATLQRRRAGQASVVVTLDRTEAPEDALPLSAELRRFWSDVDLTTATPDWLAKS